MSSLPVNWPSDITALPLKRPTGVAADTGCDGLIGLGVLLHGFVPVSLLSAIALVAFLRCLRQRLRDGWVFCADGRKLIQQDIYVPTQLKPATRAGHAGDWQQ